MATLRDVAKLAKLSTGTVSKYINGNKISENNKIKIEKAIELLKYSPNPLARKLAKGNSYTILLFVIVESPIVVSTWLHELPIIQGISDVLKTSEYRLEIEISSINLEQSNIQKLEEYTSNKSIEALILLSPWEINERLLALLDYRDFPYVIIGNGNTLHPHKSIDFDNYKPIYNIVKHQYNMGHKNFGMIAGFKDQHHMQMRVLAFENALKEMNLFYEDSIIKYGDYSLQSGYKLANEFLQSDNCPTTMICGNDYVAAGAIKAIKERGLNVPTNIAVSGFDATVVSEALDPVLTTVEVPSYEMGEKAIVELLKKLDNSDYQIKNVLLESQNIFRDSTSK